MRRKIVAEHKMSIFILYFLVIFLVKIPNLTANCQFHIVHKSAELWHGVIRGLWIILRIHAKYLYIGNQIKGIIFF